MPPSDLRAADLFTATFGEPASGMARAPGRVNLIGDHTDYSDGFVLPMAIDRYTHVAFRRRNGSLVRIISEHGGAAEFDVADLTHGGPPWSEYVRGVSWAMGIEDGPGWDGAVASDVPIGAGLSSSASLELAVAEIFAKTAGRVRNPVELARAGQRAESAWVGVECGIMDQLSVAASHAGSALLIDCRSLTTETIPVPPDVAFVILDTSTRRELVTSQYNDRRSTVERAARSLGVSALRDVELDDLGSVTRSLDDVAARRARHVITENARVLAAAETLRTGDVNAFGRLMNESHASLRDDFESSSPELDTIVSIAQSTPGCFGARVTGAGFAGCAVAAVALRVVERFAGRVLSIFADETSLNASVTISTPSAGSSVHTLP